MESYWPGMKTEPSPDFCLVVNLEEVLGTFNYDLGDPRFDNVAEQFSGDTGGYICRGLIHNAMAIPGGLNVEECVRFFPFELHTQARIFLDDFYTSLSAEVSRLEQRVRFQNPGRQFETNTQPSPMVNGYSTMTIWYHWKTPQMLQMEAALELADAEPELLGF